MLLAKPPFGIDCIFVVYGRFIGPGEKSEPKERTQFAF